MSRPRPIPLQAGEKARGQSGIPLADVVQSIQPSGIREFFDIVASRPDCISLGVGEPDFVSPEPVIEAGIEALRKGYTHYTGNQGLPDLREAISEYLIQEYSLEYDPNTEILVTVGVSQGVDLALRSIINPGDKVMYTSPNYVSYNPMIRLAGGVPLEVPVTARSRFLIPPEDLATLGNENIKAVLLNYPGNPTGASMDQEYLSVFSKKAIDNDWYIISDEIYGELTYDESHIPIALLPGMKERTLTLGGFSKSFAMTGWRIAYVCGPSEWIKGLLKIHQYSMLCAPTLSQIAAIAALRDAGSDKSLMKEAYRERRNFIVAALNECGLDCLKPEGAFYVFPSIQKTGLSSMQFAKQLLEEENVAVVPGSAFGESGEGFIRCSYATALKEIEVAIERIARFVEKVSS